MNHPFVCFLGVDVPDFGEEGRQFLIFQFERETHLRVEVAECPQLGEHRQEFGEFSHWPHPVVHDVRLQRLEVNLLNLFHFTRLHQSRSFC